MLGTGSQINKKLKQTRPRGGEQIQCVVGQFGDIKHVAFDVDSPPTTGYPNPECLGVMFLHHIVGAFIGWAYLPHHFVSFKNDPTSSRHMQKEYNELAEGKTPFLIAC